MGLADLLIYCEKRYGSPEGNQLIDQVFQTIVITAYEVPIELAKERGSFPFLVGKTEKETQALREAFIQSGFMKKMPENIRQDILKYGIRNSHHSPCRTNRINRDYDECVYWLRTLFCL